MVTDSIWGLLQRKKEHLGQRNLYLGRKATQRCAWDGGKNTDFRVRPRPKFGPCTGTYSALLWTS